jgi:hypothetical protein
MIVNRLTKVKGGSNMRRICMYLSAMALLVCVGTASAIVCPAFVHNEAILKYVDSGAVLPCSGTVVTGLVYGNSGIYTAPLGTTTPTLIPNTAGMGINSTQITEDGQWVLFNSGGPKLIRIDGQYKTTVPVTSSGSEGCCTFWWKAPSGKLEIVYRVSDSDVHAIPVTLSANAAPTFGTDRQIINAGGAISFSMGCSGNHFFSRINAAGFDGPHMVTIPASGVATTADFWVPSVNPIIGCKCTMSHDGTICCYNPGYDSWCGCIADETCLLRHKSFALLPFQEKTAPSVGWLEGMLKTKAISINWAPKKYLFLSPTDSTKGLNAISSNFWSDFKGWCYTNDNNYIVGDGNALPNGATPPNSDMQDSGSIFLIHYPTNTWYRILKPLTPVGRNTLLAFPAVWIKPGTSAITPLHGNRLEYRGVPSQGRNMFDIRGRRIESISAAAPKLTSGVYYSVDRNGVMKRIVVNH